jgi:LmbE family N-acetylglucosaminyl deacetylase
MNVVGIGAHPDDIEIGAGGSIALHRTRGDAVQFLILTNGGELAEPESRKREAKRSAEILDVEDLHFLDYEDTKVPYDHDIVKRIDDHLEDFGTDRVYAHTQEDTHQDHRNTALSTIAAARGVNEVLAFESPSTRSSFSPQYYKPLPESVLEQKIKSQREKKYLESEAMKGLARFRGRQANSRYAEAFQVIRFQENHFQTETLDTPASKS